MNFKPFFFVFLFGCQSSEVVWTDEVRIDTASELAKNLSVLHTELRPPQPGDWLANHNEPGQTFIEYRVSNPVLVSEERKKLYVMPLGELTEAERKVIEKTTEYLGIFYQLPVELMEEVPLNVPDGSKRMNFGNVQYHTKYILYDILAPELPADAVALIGFTARDLYPDRRWNFVFGQASLKDRVGIWSINRYGNPATNHEALKQCLFRAMKVSTHETGHMLSIRHCTAYRCVMNGSNTLEESDRKPPYFCSECLAKVKWNIDFDVHQRFHQIHQFFEREGISPIYSQYFSIANDHLDAIKAVKNP